MSVIRKISLPVAIILLSLGAASCGGSFDRQFFSLESFSVSTIAESSDIDSIADEMPEGFDGRWEVTSEGVMPVKVGQHDITALVERLSELASAGLDSSDPAVRLPAELRPLSEERRKSASDSVAPGSRLMKRTSLDLLTPRVAVFDVYSYSYPEGAAHGMYSNIYVNFDVAEGKIVTLASLFMPGYEERLQPVILERLKGSGEPLLVDDDEVYVSDNFRITDDGVEFVYGLYSVGPYAAGEQTVAFNSYELSSLLTPGGKALLGIGD